MEECIDVLEFAGKCSAEDSSVVSVTQMLLAEVRMIDVPSVQAYLVAIQDALRLSGAAISAWFSVLMLVLSPMWTLAWILMRTVGPPVLSAVTAFGKFQASLPPSTLCAEAGVVTLGFLVILLRRFIIRRRLVSRAQRSLSRFRTRVSRRYYSFTAAVERNFRLSARAFPHVVFWFAGGLLMWIAPGILSLAHEKLWVWNTITWPTLRALYLILLMRSQGNAGHPRSRHEGDDRQLQVQDGAARHLSTARSPTVTKLIMDIDRALMYWAVFALASCCGVLAWYLPFAASLLPSITPPVARSTALLVVVWMHLPGPGSGLKVVYASLEPLVHKYVTDVRPPDPTKGAWARWRHVLVFMSIASEEQVQVIFDNVADSWMLLPTCLCFFMPGFLTRLGCLYAGMLVPAVNSIKTIGRRRSGQAASGGARLRWLTYWAAFGTWCHASILLSGLLRILPLSRHMELALLLWFQLPLFRGSARMLDFLDDCLTRWATVPPKDGGGGGGGGDNTAVAGRRKST